MARPGCRRWVAGLHAPSPAEDPLAGPDPLGATPRSRLLEPHRGLERARRVSGGRLGAGSADSAGSRAASSQAGEGRRVEGEGGGGESAAPRPYKERPGEGAGRGGEGGRGRKLPQEGALVLPRGRRLSQGSPTPAPAAQAWRGPPLP